MKNGHYGCVNKSKTVKSIASQDCDYIQDYIKNIDSSESQKRMS